MQSLIKSLLKPLLPQPLLAAWRNNRLQKIKSEWEQQGSPAPAPHSVKQLTIREYQQRYRHTILVETGTYMGEMVEAQKRRFKKVYSIELGKELFQKAQERFKTDQNVFIRQGDSGHVLPEILKEIHEPAIFWLDGHYSAGITAKGEKDCPIFEELEAILAQRTFNHVILIDDARHFTGEGDYPTVDSLTDFIHRRNPSYRIEVKHDIICCAI